MISKGTKQAFLAGAIVATGFLIPILPRWVVPIITPWRYYYGTLETFFDSEFIVETAWMFLLTVLPFGVLAMVSWIHLSEVGLSSFELKVRTSGIIVAYVLSLGIGLWVHSPQTAAGVNFGPFFFPLYAAVTMVIGYWITRGVGERLQARKKMKGKH